MRDTADRGQGSLFQDLFFQRLNLSECGSGLPKTKWRVEAECRFVNVGQLDLLLTSADQEFWICIENKPCDQTIDQNKQPLNYQNLLIGRHQQNYVLIYLSKAAQLPGTQSRDEKTREDQLGSHKCINLTYHDLLLPLLDDWCQAQIPENIRYFLECIRHRLEDWLGAPSTKLMRLIQNQEIATELVKSQAHVRAAFAIKDSLGSLCHQLLTSLAADLQFPLPGLV